MKKYAAEFVIRGKYTVTTKGMMKQTFATEGKPRK